MLYDTHCHLNLAEFENDCEAIIEDCLSQEIELNIVGTDHASSVLAVEIARKYAQGVHAVVGAHPDNFLSSESQPSFHIQDFRTLAADAKVVGIGECGLDYYRLPDGMDRAAAKALQGPAFIAQIELANEFHKALVIHCRPSANSDDAYEDCLEILHAHKPEMFEIHSFTGPWEICKRFLDLGAYVAVNAIVTFDKTGTLAEVCRNVPDDRLLLETDAPFLAPAPFRGKRNQPRYMIHTAEYLAGLRKVPLAELSAHTTKNAQTLFFGYTA